MGEVAIIAESAVEERVIALQTVKGFVDTTDTLFIVEEIGPVETARANFVAIASDASLKGSIACHTFASFVVSIIEIFLASEAIILVLACPAVRQVSLAKVANICIEIVRIRDTFITNIPICTFLTTSTKISARNTLPLIHKSSIQTLAAPTLSASLTILELL